MRISSAELIRNFGKYSDLALKSPVVVTKNGRDRLVVLAIEEYEFLRDLAASLREESAAEAEIQGETAFDAIAKG